MQTAGFLCAITLLLGSTSAWILPVPKESFSFRKQALPSSSSSSQPLSFKLPVPETIYSPDAVVALCMNALERNSDPLPNAGLEVCWNFSSEMCRQALGGSFAKFVEYAGNPTFQSMVNHQGWVSERISEVAGGPTRGAMFTIMVTVSPKGDAEERHFLWTLQQQRRPPNSGCWLVYECLFTKNAFEQTL